MKQLNIFICLMISLILLPCTASSYDGVILEIESSGVIVKIEQPDGNLVGAELDMTYKAGMLPMDMGRYKVRSIVSGVAQLDIIATNNPPDKGMKVILDRVGKSGNPGNIQGSTIIGNVVETDNDNVKIKIPSFRVVGINSRVDLYYKTSAGQDMNFGEWKVTQSSGNILMAVPVDMTSPPMVGLEARITIAQEIEINRNLPGEGELVSKRDSGIIFRDPYEELDQLGKKEPIKLLGSTFPEKTAKEYAISGDKYYFSKNYEMAYEEYSKAAQMGHAGAQRLIGNMYHFGQYVQKDDVKAFEWYEISAQQNNPMGIYSYGNAIAKGEGTKKDLEKAHDLFLKAADMGEPKAQYSLGVLYYKGLGVDKDYSKALEWFKISSTQNTAGAFYALGIMHEFGQGVQKDQNKAISYYKNAADLDHDKAKQKLTK